MSVTPSTPPLGPCAACKFFIQDPPRVDKPSVGMSASEGHCRHSSPRLGQWALRYPWTEETEGCGQFKPRRES